MTRARPLLIDCDPGIDDAVALALALASPEVDVLAVTTVAGNAPVDLVTRNALQLLHAFGRPDVPVAAGATRALVRAVAHGEGSPHGGNGLGGAVLGGSTATAVPEHAVERMAAVLRAAGPRSVTVAAIGPLTNVALLLALHPGCTEAIDRLVVMGGSTGPGNITPVAEFNTWSDPEAAHRVLEDTRLDVDLVGLDVTRSAVLREEDLGRLGAGSEQGRLLAEMILGYGDRTDGGWPLHDALAVAAVVAPDLLVTRPASVEVDTETGATRGRTLATPGARRRAEAGAGAGRCRIAVGVDVDRFRALVLERAGRSRPRPDGGQRPTR